MNNDNPTREQQQILASVSREPGSDCWIWIRQISNGGYGKITMRGPDGLYTDNANRDSYRAFVGPVPERGVVMQKCGNRLCVNPEHLELKNT